MYGFPVPPRRPSTPTLPIKRRAQLGITFLDYRFTEPALFDTALKPQCGGLYVVLVLDARGNPRPYRALYIGQSGDLSERLSTAHEKYPSWVRASAGSPLYVAFYKIEFSLSSAAAEQRLISYYRPDCNEVYNPPLTRLNTLRALL
jgi:hypothetical protein